MAGSMLATADEYEVAVSPTDFLRPPAPVPPAQPLGLLRLLRALLSNPLEAWSERYLQEPIVITRLPFRDVAVVSDPEAIRRILVANVDNYRKDHVQKRMLTVLSGGLLTAEGNTWLRQRRMLTPIFTRQTVRSFVPIVLKACDNLIARWRLHDGGVLNVADEVTRLTLDVLEHTIFSGGLGGATTDIRAAMRLFFDRIGRIDPFDLIEAPGFIPRLTRLSSGPTSRFFDHAVDTMISTRRQSLADGRAPRDLLSLLLTAASPETGLRMSEAEVRANVITFMAAGHETTANAITWSLYLLSISGQWRNRIVTEAERELVDPSETVVERLVDTRLVVDEALRLYPPLAAISRVALGPDRLAGVPIRAGTLIVIAPFVLHRHRRLWTAPEVFDPNRFLRKDWINRFSYLPFGAGPRGCIGSVFALQETTLAVASIARQFELAVAPGHEVWPVHRITLRPRGGLPMLIRNRKGASTRFIPSSALQFGSCR